MFVLAGLQVHLPVRSGQSPERKATDAEVGGFVQSVGHQDRVGRHAYFEAMAEGGRARVLLVDAPAVLSSAQLTLLSEAAGANELRHGLKACLRAERTVPLDELGGLLSAAFDRAARAVAEGEKPRRWTAAMDLLVGAFARLVGQAHVVLAFGRSIALTPESAAAIKGYGRSLAFRIAVLGAPMPDLSIAEIHDRLVPFVDLLKSSAAWTGLPEDAKRVFKDLGTDLEESLGTTGWLGLPFSYRSAWMAEIKRRVSLHQPWLVLDKGVLSADTLALTRQLLRDALPHLGPKAGTIVFSQYKCNEHFQSQYGGSPAWIASKSIAYVARKLRSDIGKSADFRISVSLIGGRWIAWNNRGFTAHCLASVIPARIVPDPAPSAAELHRLGEVMEGYRYRSSLPESRRDSRVWGRTAPCSVMSVVYGDADKDVLYTVQNGMLRDAGNQFIMEATNLVA